MPIEKRETMINLNCPGMVMSAARMICFILSLVVAKKVIKFYKNKIK